MRILFVGDVVGRSGRAIVAEVLPGLIADWRLDLVVVADQSLPRLLSRVPAFFLGRLTPGAGVAMHAVTEVALAVDGVGELHLDGEPRRFDGRLAVRVHPRALDVIVPHAP